MIQFFWGGVGYSIYKIKKSYKELRKDNDINFKDGWYFYIWQIFLHEIIHIYQARMREEMLYDNSVLMQILLHSDAVCSGDIRLKDKYISPYIIRKMFANIIYSICYDNMPEERHAQAVSYETMINLYGSMLPYKKNELLTFKKLFAEEMFIGYEDIDKGSCSVREFYKFIKREDIFNDLDFSSYNSHERYLYGMPLSFNELISEEEKLGVRK